jgi:hypothetical protein
MVCYDNGILLLAGIEKQSLITYKCNDVLASILGLQWIASNNYYSLYEQPSFLKDLT